MAQSLAQDGVDLLTVLAGIADPRRSRGIRHRLAVIVGLALCAVLAGTRSFTAIAEWAADADEGTLAGLGVTGAVPSESTFRRVLQRLDPDAFDELAGQGVARRTAPVTRQLRMIAVDGKTLPGSGHGGQHSRHLLAALDHARGAVLGQVEVGAKTNEIPMFTTLLDRMNIAGAVITADALHAQHGHATYLHQRARTTCRSSSAISLACPGATCRWPTISGNAAMAAPLQIRARNGPRIMASLRNLAITILRLAGASNIAAALRYHARRPSRPLHTITKC